MPLEGMTSWPESDRPPLKAPGYVRMPGRPKKERRREPTEQPKGVRMSKVGTVIRCGKCKGIGHNRSTCERLQGSSPAASASSLPRQQSVSSANDLMQLSQSQNSEAKTKKRKRASGSEFSAVHPGKVILL